MKRFLLAAILCLCVIPLLADVEFTGGTTTTRINCGSGSTLDDLEVANSGMTVSAWIYAQTRGGNGVGRIVAKEDTVSPTTPYWRFFVGGASDADMTLRFDRGYPTTDLQAVTVADAILQNTWHHVLVTWNGSATAANVIFYVDGSVISHGSDINGSGTKASDAAISFAIGSVSGTTTRAFDGYIGEVAVWNVILTTAERDQLQKSLLKRMPLQIKPANLKGYWPLDECAHAATCTTSNMFLDYSGNANSGNPVSSPLGFANVKLTYME